MNKTFLQTTILMLMISLILLSCSPKPTNSEEELWGQWAYTSMENGNEYYAFDLEFTKDGKLLSPNNEKINSAAISFSQISSGKLKITVSDESANLNYEITGNTLTIYFDKGYNQYVRGSLLIVDLPFESQLEESVISDEVITKENIDTIAPLRLLNRGAISDIAWSSDSSQIIIGSADGLFIYSSENFSDQGFIKTRSHVAKFFLLGDEDTVATVICDKPYYVCNAIYIYNLVTGEEVSLLYNQEKPIESMAYSYRKNLLAFVGEDEAIHVFDINSGIEINRLLSHENVDYIEFSPDGKMIASSSYNKALIRDVLSGNVNNVLEWSEGGVVRDFIFSSDGEILTTITGFDNHDTWDLNTSERLENQYKKFSWTTLRNAGFIFSDDTNLVAVPLDDLSVQLKDLNSDQVLHVFNGQESYIKTMQFSPLNKHLFIVDENETVYIWDIETGTLQSKLSKHFDSVYNMAISPDGRLICTMSLFGKTSIWDLSTGDLISTLSLLDLLRYYDTSILFRKGFLFYDTAFSNDGKTLITATGDGSIQYWDVESGSLIESTNHLKIFIKNLFFINSARLIAIEDRDNNIRIHKWDDETFPLLFELSSSIEKCRPLEFSDDGLYFACGLQDGEIYIWDLNKGSHLFTLEGPASGVVDLSFSSDGKKLASVSDGRIFIWELNSGLLVRIIGKPEYYYFQATFSPDGELITSLGLGSLDIFDINDGNQIATKNSLSSNRFSHYSHRSIYFSPDGSMLILNLSPVVEVWGISKH